MDKALFQLALSNGLNDLLDLIIDFLEVSRALLTCIEAKNAHALARAGRASSPAHGTSALGLLSSGRIRHNLALLEAEHSLFLLVSGTGSPFPLASVLILLASHITRIFGACRALGFALFALRCEACLARLVPI